LTSLGKLDPSPNKDALNGKHITEKKKRNTHPQGKKLSGSLWQKGKKSDLEQTIAQGRTSRNGFEER